MWVYSNRGTHFLVSFVFVDMLLDVVVAVSVLILPERGVRRSCLARWTSSTHM